MNLIPFNVEVESIDDDGVRVVSVTGELDQATADKLREPLRETIEAGGAVMINMCDCTFIDSTGLGVIVEAWKQLQARNGDGAALSICCPEPEVRRLLEVTGLDQAIEIRDSPEDAIAVLKK
jgi:anti-anti-sigma factor